MRFEERDGLLVRILCHSKDLAMCQFGSVSGCVGSLHAVIQYPFCIAGGAYLNWG